MGTWWAKNRCFVLIGLIQKCLLMSLRIRLRSDAEIEIANLHAKFEHAVAALQELRDTLIVLDVVSSLPEVPQDIAA